MKSESDGISDKKMCIEIIYTSTLIMPPRANPRTLRQIHHQIIILLSVQLAILIPTLVRIIHRFYIKVPYHTSILSGEGWVQELLNGHPDRIRCELGVHKHVFDALIVELRALGYDSSRFVTLEEQLAIFLHISVTGTTIRHAGERFQRANETISWQVTVYLSHN